MHSDNIYMCKKKKHEEEAGTFICQLTLVIEDTSAGDATTATAGMDEDGADGHVLSLISFILALNS